MLAPQPVGICALDTTGPAAAKLQSHLHTRYVLVVNLHTAAATDFQGEVLVGDSLTLQLVIFHNQYLEGRRGNAS